MTAAARGTLAGLALGFLLASSLRALVSTTFYLSLVTLRLNWSALWLVALLSPLAAPLVRRAPWPAAVAGACVAALPFARFTPAFAPIAAGGVAAGLLALAASSRGALAGAVVGLALNGALLLPGASHDPMLAPLGSLAAVALAAAAVAWREAPGEAPSLPGGLAWGALLAVEAAFLASPFVVARHLGVPAWATAAATLAGLAVGLLLGARAGPRLVLAAGVAAAGHVALLPGAAAVASLAVLQAALAASALRLARPHGGALALVLGPALFGLSFFGQVMGPAEWALAVPVLTLAPLALAARDPRPAPRAPRPVLAAVALGLLLTPAAVPAPMVAPHEGAELVVVSWNVHQGFGNRGALDPEVYAAALVAMGPDVVILQEAATARLSSGGLDVVAYLARAAGLREVTRGSGVAILSRFPAAAGHEPRSEGWTTVVALDVHGEVVHVQGVHLARSRDARAAQVRALLEDANATGGARILAGDLNSCAAATCFGGRPSDGVHEALAATYRDAWTQRHAADDPAGHTHPAWDPRRRIDVVMVRGLDVIDAGPVRSQLTAWGSDHLPVVARLRSPMPGEDASRVSAAS